MSNILDETENIKKWKKAYLLLSQAIQGPNGKFDLTKDRKRFSMDWYYPILSGCLKQHEKLRYIHKIFKDFYHHHRKRNDSVSFIEKEASSKAIKYFINEVLNEN